MAMLFLTVDDILYILPQLSVHPTLGSEFLFVISKQHQKTMIYVFCLNCQSKHFLHLPAACTVSIHLPPSRLEGQPTRECSSTGRQII